MSTATTRQTRRPGLRDQGGIALIIAMMSMLLMTALGVALVLTTSSETMIAGNFRNTYEGSYAADAALERAMGDILTVPDWNQLLSGATRSAFIDGPPSGARTLPDGSTIDLGQAIDMANCNKVTACSAADLADASVPGRPWGKNNPQWQLYAYGNLAGMLPAATINSQYYVMVFAGDDPSENDSDPLHDGVIPCAANTLPVANPPPPAGSGGFTCNPGAGVIALRAEAFGPRGAHTAIEMTVGRTDSQDYNDGVGQAGVRVLSWREVR